MLVIIVIKTINPSSSMLSFIQGLIQSDCVSAEIVRLLLSNSVLHVKKLKFSNYASRNVKSQHLLWHWGWLLVLVKAGLKHVMPH